jgi:formate hydrogenlyase subunit 6/NADH:ubiquinone oxidoreductase subunit I
MCSLCGLCVEVCPTDTLRYSTRYDEAMYTRAATYDDLLEPFGGS